MEWAGYLSAIGVGVVLGLLGAGGSILSVPIFVYLFRVPAVTATVYSLFVVGFSSLTGAIAYFRQGLVDWRAAAFFAPPAFFGIYLSRRVLLDGMPAVLYSSRHFHFTKNELVLHLFAAVMLAAAIAMIRKRSPRARGTKRRGLLALQGFFVGMVTGMVGAGGGFLIVPALVLLVGLPMKCAVGTSLAIITVNSLFGFWMGYRSVPAVDWVLLLQFLGFAIFGNFLGRALNRLIPADKLRALFGWFVLAMSLWIFYQELSH